MMEERDFDFYEESEDEEVVLQGVTGKVTSYTFTNMSYPCIIFKPTFSCQNHQLRVIQNMIKSGNRSLKDIAVYFAKETELFKVGELSGLQIGALLDMVGVDCLDGYFDESSPISGSLLYSLCTTV